MQNLSSQPVELQTLERRIPENRLGTFERDSTPIGASPMNMFAGWQSGQRAIFERNARYECAGNPHLHTEKRDRVEHGETTGFSPAVLQEEAEVAEMKCEATCGRKRFLGSCSSRRLRPGMGHSTLVLPAHSAISAPSCSMASSGPRATMRHAGAMAGGSPP